MPTTQIRTLALALLAVILFGTARPDRAAGEITRKGPYLVLAPYTQAIHVDMMYVLADYQTSGHTEEWLAFWRWGAGWAFSQEFMLGFEFGDTGESPYDTSHEYSTSLLRATWFPTGGAWYLTGGGGMGSANAPFDWTMEDQPGMAYDSGWLVTLGAGYEVPIWRNLALQAQADWLQQRSYSHEGQSGYRMDVDSWVLGVTLIWYP